MLIDKAVENLVTIYVQR